MAIRVAPVNATPAIAVIDLAELVVAGIGPVGESALTDSAEHRIELFLAHKKGVMLADDVAVFPHEVQRHAVVEFDAVERAEPDRRTAAEEFGKRRCGSLRIAGRNDRVIELDGHLRLQKWAGACLLQQFKRFCVGRAAEILVDRAVKHRLLRRDPSEQRHRRAELQVVGRMKNLQRGLAFDG